MSTTRQNGYFKWVATVLAGIIVAVAAAWANDVNQRLMVITDRLTSIEIRLGVR